MRMRRVMLESPYRAATTSGRKLNAEYARLSMQDSLLRGEAPFASHLFYAGTGVLDDDQLGERALGIEAGFARGFACAQAWVAYIDLGVSPGMLKGIEFAEGLGFKVEERILDGALRDDFLVVLRKWGKGDARVKG